MTVSLTHFAARAGDHNDRAMRASPFLTVVLEQRLATRATVVGEPEPSHPTTWDEELAIALLSLRQMAAHYDTILSEGRTPVTALSRCAVALATLPIVAKHRPDAVVIWFDAHADLNTPLNTSTGYLGGLALSGPIGLWESGLGAGLSATNAVLVGTRDLDVAEQNLVTEGLIDLVAIGPDMAAKLRRVIAGRPVYVHIDCDVLEPGIVPTDYTVPDGMTLAQLGACARVLADSEVIGLEIGELETDAEDHGAGMHAPARTIICALEPLFENVAR